MIEKGDEHNDDDKEDDKWREDELKTLCLICIRAGSRLFGFKFKLYDKLKWLFFN